MKGRYENKEKSKTKESILDMDQAGHKNKEQNECIHTHTLGVRLPLILLF